MSRRFDVGHRVIVTNAHPEVDGYYGHIVSRGTAGTTKPMVLVSLEGRVGGEAEPHYLDPHGDDPCVLYEDELQHAD